MLANVPLTKQGRLNKIQRHFIFVVCEKDAIELFNFNCCNRDSSTVLYRIRGRNRSGKRRYGLRPVAMQENLTSLKGD